MAGPSRVYRRALRCRAAGPGKCRDLPERCGFPRDQRGVQRRRLGEYAGTTRGIRGCTREPLVMVTDIGVWTRKVFLDGIMDGWYMENTLFFVRGRP